MSGYLEVKYPFKSNLGLNPFKSWKRQWCILRPSPTSSGGFLAVYCSEAGASAGTVELPSGFVVRWATSRTRPHAFAVYPADEPRKPRVLLATTSLQDANIWMEKIRSLINGNKLMESNSLLKDSYSVTINITELSRKCGLSGDSTVTVSSSGVLVSRTQKLGVFMEWKHVTGAALSTSGRNGICVVSVHSEFKHGGGELRFCSPLASELTSALQAALSAHGALATKAMSKSDGDLRANKCCDMESGDVRIRSWYSGPSEVSLDDLDLVMSKDCKRIPTGQLSRYSAARHLAPLRDDCMSDRRSLVSIASGIYEEIPEGPPHHTPLKGPPHHPPLEGPPHHPPLEGPPHHPPLEGPTQTLEDVYCKMSRDVNFLKCKPVETSLTVRLSDLEPQYECVGECVYGTMRRTRRHPPPPLPPRTIDSVSKPSSLWERQGVTRHSSLGSLPRGGPAPSAPTAPPAPSAARTLPRWDKSRQAFSAFRKRLKSDSRTAISPKSETKDKDVETKKKKFDFAPSRDIFKSFKVSRKMKNLKITNTLGKESKSCEFLDETEHVSANRCSKSVECLEGNDEFDGFETDLSMEFNDDSVAALALPPEIVQLILSSHDKILTDDTLGEKMSINLRDEVEGDYMPMSPIVPQPDTLDHHYIVMSPRPNIA